MAPGDETNPNIPRYVSSSTPWYLIPMKPRLKHQRNSKQVPNNIEAETCQADKYRQGACVNCGATSHNENLCIERPRGLGAKWTQKHTAPDEKIDLFDLDYVGKTDRWNGYDPTTFARVIKRYELRNGACGGYLKDQKLKKLEGKNNEGDGGTDDELEVDEAKEERENGAQA